MHRHVAGGGHKEKPFGKAGNKFHAYRRAAKAYFKVKGVAMNPVNHPHGGGGPTRTWVSQHRRQERASRT